ncbi:hypothetical protein BU16DRAFT_587138 [Lophium mytilinum]|uniref:Uncharacterized protein n=1 Tax=Lophium mytilinum TaxID=390894 RepID=A0A6A6RBU7_9PEZI|nr:hypothetical protein BU16DRAFT_587138 [Lophium mytilinum]
MSITRGEPVTHARLKKELGDVLPLPDASVKQLWLASHHLRQHIASMITCLRPRYVAVNVLTARNPAVDDKDKSRYSAAIVGRRDNARREEEVICGPAYGNSRREALYGLLDTVEEKVWEWLHPEPTEQPQGDQMEENGANSEERANKRRKPNEPTGLTAVVREMGI